MRPKRRAKKACLLLHFIHSAKVGRRQSLLSFFDQHHNILGLILHLTMLFSSMAPSAPSFSFLLTDNNTRSMNNSARNNHSNAAHQSPHHSPSFAAPWKTDKNELLVPSSASASSLQHDTTRKRHSDPTQTIDIVSQTPPADSIELSPPRKRPCFGIQTFTNSEDDMLLSQQPQLQHQPSPVTPTQKASKEWWKIHSHKSKDFSDDQCFVCRASLGPRHQTNASSSSTTETVSPSSAAASTTTTTHHGMPRNALHKYFMPKSGASQQHKQQPQQTQPSSSLNTTLSSTIMTSVSSSSTNTPHNNTFAITNRCHFCNHALCSSCTLTCLACHDNFCTICCRSTEHLQNTHINNEEGHVCFDCLPQEEDSWASDTHTRQMGYDDDEDNSRMSID